mgnify:CR=1 FL=1
MEQNYYLQISWQSEGGQKYLKFVQNCSHSHNAHYSWNSTKTLFSMNITDKRKVTRFIFSTLGISTSNLWLAHFFSCRARLAAQIAWVARNQRILPWVSLSRAQRCAAENNNQGSALFLIICTGSPAPQYPQYPQSQVAVRWSLSSCAGRSWQIEQIVKKDTNNDINAKY